MTKEEPTEQTRIALIGQDVGYIKAKMEEINKKVDGLTSLYVLNAEFQPVKMIVYGMVGLILVGVIGAILAMVIGSR